MPSNYAHYRFGVTILPTLPGDVRRTIQRFRRLFDVGLHGPDIFYYQPLLTKGTNRFLGIKFHEQSGRDFFPRVCRTVRMEKSEATQAYLYGLLLHYCLDSVCHPFVEEQTKLGPARHAQIETEFDRYLLELDGKVPPCIQDLSPHLKLTPGECETVAKFYPGTSGNTIKACLNNMGNTLRLLTVPEGPRRLVLRKTMELAGFGDMVMHCGPDSSCAQMNEPFLARYEEAAAHVPEMLAQLQANMTYNAPFEDEFQANFG